MVLTTKVITTREGLEELAGEWNELLQNSAANCIFLTWEWISTWISSVRPEAQLLVVTVRERNGRLVAVAPFYRTRLRLLRLVNYRCLRVLGDDESGAEYPDMIVREGFELGALPLVRTVLLEKCGCWDCIWMPNVSGWTGARQRLEILASDGIPYCHERDREFAALDLPGTHDEYLMLLAHKRRAYVRRETRRLLDRPGAQFVSCTAQGELAPLLTALFDLHRQHWEAVGEGGSFVRHPPMARFYEQFAPLALRRGWLRLHGLAVGWRLRAVQYGYAYDGSYYAMQEGYEPDDAAPYGNVLRNLVFKACIAEGLVQYDFLGEFTDHKRLWRANRRVGNDVLIGRQAIRNAVLFAGGIWPTGRYLRPASSRSSSPACARVPQTACAGVAAN